MREAVGTVTIRHVDVVDPSAGRVETDRQIRIVDGTITEVSADDMSALGADEIDGSTLHAIPGLIDCHVHVNAVTASLGTVSDMSPAYVTARASQILRGMLARGFTTVRDVGGADFGIAAATEEGLLAGPQIIFGGKALSQTGGHGDLRPAGRDIVDEHYALPVLGRIADGVSEVRRAARDEIRRGASHIKIMISGGCASPTDRVDSLQFSDDELRAIVDEAASANLYCAGHAYTADAVNRGLRLGIRTIEHGNLLDETSIALFLERNAYYVPTLTTYVAQMEDGKELGLDAGQLDKISSVVDQGFKALELADRAGVNIAFGTDLLGEMHARQSDEFALRSTVQSSQAILLSATVTAAALLRRESELGVITPGARADVVLTRGNPMADIAVLAQPASGIAHVIRRGVPS
nr:amidohydrolase family protein [Rhodococcus sp. (in: high G+C Gram-positive bacteria)]